MPDGDAAKAPKLNKLGRPGVEQDEDAGTHGGAARSRRISWSCMRRGRTNRRIPATAEDTVWQQEFEEMFPYDETEDQLTAIDAIKAGHGEHGRSWTG